MNIMCFMKRLLYTSPAALIAVIIFSAFMLAFAQAGNQQTTNNTAPAEQKIIDGIIASVNDDIISSKDVAGELLIQGKLQSGNCALDDILQRIIEDMLIFQELSKYPPAPLLNISIDVTGEGSSIASNYGGENNIKKIMYASGLTPEDLTVKLKYKKIIFLYLNYKIFSAIYISVDEIKSYYENNILRLQKGEDDNFYKHYDEIKNALAAEKTKSAYDDYISSLKKASVIIIHQDILAELKKQCTMKPFN